MNKVVIDAKFRKLIPALRPEEYETLSKDLRADGCRDALLVWYEKDILLDGHNRYEICTEHDIPFKIERINLPDRAAAEMRILRIQLGRRNLTPEHMALLRGKLYESEKKADGIRGPKKPDQNDQAFEGTAGRLAKEFGVSAGTVRRDARFAKAHDKLQAMDIDIDTIIDKGATRAAVIEAARTDDKETAMEILTPTKEAEPTEKPPVVPKGKRVRPRIGLHYARVAVKHLEFIPKSDLERKPAFDLVERWIHEHR